jgi:hypothetical protein
MPLNKVHGWCFNPEAVANGHPVPDVTRVSGRSVGCPSLQRTPDFLLRASDRTACAAFIKESRI